MTEYIKIWYHPGKASKFDEGPGQKFNNMSVHWKCVCGMHITAFGIKKHGDRLWCECGHSVIYTDSRVMSFMEWLHIYSRKI